MANFSLLNFFRFIEFFLNFNMSDQMLDIDNNIPKRTCPFSV